MNKPVKIFINSYNYEKKEKYVKNSIEKFKIIKILPDILPLIFLIFTFLLLYRPN